MKIGILATGITPDELLDDFGSYADMLRELLLPEIADVSFETYDVRDGVFPIAASDCDAWLITGSKFSAYEDLPWIHRLKALIRQIWESQRPMVGICFGHQIVAEALGGRVEQSANGWGVGLHRYQMVGPWPSRSGGGQAGGCRGRGLVGILSLRGAGLWRSHSDDTGPSGVFAGL